MGHLRAFRARPIHAPSASPDPKLLAATRATAGSKPIALSNGGFSRFLITSVHSGESMHSSAIAGWLMLLAYSLFIAQGVDRVQTGRPVGRIEAKEDADGQRHSHGQEHTLASDQRLRATQQGCDHLRAHYSQPYTH